MNGNICQKWRLKTVAVIFLILACGSTNARADGTSDPNVRVDSRPGYSTTAIDPTATALPAAYLGNDPFAISTDLYLSLEAPKGEFETTDQYKKRIEANETAPVVGDLNPSSTYAFTINPTDVNYDADTGQMTVRVGLDNFSGIPVTLHDNNIKHDVALSLGSVVIKTQSFTGVNAFGTEVTTTLTTYAKTWLLPINFDKLPIKKAADDDGINYHADFVIPMNVDIAKAAKSNIALLLICHLAQDQGHYVDGNQAGDATNAIYCLLASVDQLWMYNTATGTVYVRLQPVGDAK